MKRIINIIGLLLCICLLGCVQTSVKEVEQSSVPEVEEIVLWSYYETEEQKQGLDELVLGFNRSQDKYYMRWEYQGPATEFNKKLAIGITDNQLPDIVIVDNPDMHQYVEQEIFEDITEEIEKFEDLNQYYANVLSSVVYDGRYYGFPFCCNNVGLIYNKDIFNETGFKIPETWEEFIEVAVALSNEDRYGFAMSSIAGEQGAFQMLPWILSAGDDLDTLGRDGTVEAFELIQTLIQNQALSKESLNWSQNDVAKKFIAGESAMMENGPWVFPELNEAGINYGVAKLPIKNREMSVAGGENFGILRGKNIEGAIAFIRYYIEDENMLNVNLRTNSLPPKKALAEQILNVKPEQRIFVEQMEQCISRASYAGWAEAREYLSDIQLKIITEQIEPEEIPDMFKVN
jgi:ABC-type sugar transport system, periplasmic component